MMRKYLWKIAIILCIIIGLYPAIYFIVPISFGLLLTKSETLLHNTLWNLAFDTHIILGGLSLLIGWTQFNEQWRIRYRKLHNRIGMVYVGAALLSAIAGFYLAFFATGGIISTIGFGSLAMIWFSVTLYAFIAIKNKEIVKHQRMMIYSYAACFAAVTLRLWLPLLQYILGDFIIAYRTVAWLCWVPNLILAAILNKKTQAL